MSLVLLVVCLQGDVILFVSPGRLDDGVGIMVTSSMPFNPGEDAGTNNI